MRCPSPVSLVSLVSLVVAPSAIVLVACAETSQPPPATTASPVTSVASEQPPPAAAPPSDGGAIALAAADAAPPAHDDGADPHYRACGVDADCVAVERVGCCHNGRKVAVAVAQRDAYQKSFTCPDAHPICPTYKLRFDDRAGYCDGASHLCGLK